MAEFSVGYTISTDFSNGVTSDKLVTEVQASSIVISLNRVDTLGDACYAVFNGVGPLSTGDKTTLDGLVAAHDGLPLPDGFDYVRIHGVQEENNGQLPVVNSPSPNDWHAYFAGAGDDPGTGRPGGGNSFVVTFDGTETGAALAKST